MIVPPPTHLQSIMSCVIRSKASKLLLSISLVLILSVVAVSGDFYTDFTINWGDGRAVISEDGSSLSLSLDNTSGSGFESYKEYLFGNIDMQIKLVPGNSAGTVTAYYLSSKGDTHDEIDFEFLGNLSGDPYTLHTNVFTQGKGSREQQFSLWFDPTTDFHTYSVLWTSQRIRFSVDGLPIREFKNLEYLGVAFPTNQPMKIYSSLWNADQWATRGGLIKTDWTQAPFTASYRNFTYTDTTSFASQDLNSDDEGRLQWVRATHMIYNYCTDANRISQGLPVECTTTN